MRYVATRHITRSKDSANTGADLSLFMDVYGGQLVLQNLINLINWSGRVAKSGNATDFATWHGAEADFTLRVNHKRANARDKIPRFPHRNYDNTLENLEYNSKNTLPSLL